MSSGDEDVVFAQVTTPKYVVLSRVYNVDILAARMVDWKISKKLHWKLF